MTWNFDAPIIPKKNATKKISSSPITTTFQSNTFLVIVFLNEINLLNDNVVKLYKANELFDCYQMTQFSGRFISLPIGQLNCWAKSAELERGPMTLYCAGLCGPLRICCCKLSRVCLLHHMLA